MTAGRPRCSEPGEPDRRVALHRRDQAELLAEELRRLDPDDVYGESLAWLFSDARVDDSPESPESDTFTLNGLSAVAEQATADQRLAEQVEASAQEPAVVDAAATERWTPTRARPPWRPSRRSRANERPEVIVHRDAKLLAKAVAGAAGHPAGRRGRGPRYRLAGAHRRRDRHRGALRAGRRARRGTPWTGGIWTSGGGTSGSCRPGTRSGTRPARGRPCSTTSTSDPARVHPMPPSDGPDGDDPDAAAARYATWLSEAAPPEDHGPVPSFDVLLLGIGPEGHIASLFPGMPALYDERPVVAVRNAPKPPPDAADADAAVDQRGQGGLDPGLGPGKGRRGARWRCRAPARCRCRRRVRAVGSARCSSWTPTQPGSCRPRSAAPRLTELVTELFTELGRWPSRRRRRGWPQRRPSASCGLPGTGQAGGQAGQRHGREHVPVAEAGRHRGEPDQHDSDGPRQQGQAAPAPPPGDDPGGTDEQDDAQQGTPQVEDLLVSDHEAGERPHDRGLAQARAGVVLQPVLVLRVVEHPPQGAVLGHRGHVRLEPERRPGPGDVGLRTVPAERAPRGPTARLRRRPPAGPRWRPWRTGRPCCRRAWRIGCCH